MSELTFEPGIDPGRLEPRFLSTLQWFARSVMKHRYKGKYGLKVHVTSARRAGDTGAHGSDAAVDIRGTFAPAGSKERHLLDIWLGMQWAEACTRTGWALNQWGFGTYPDDLHYHLDTRPHTGPDLYGAVWTER